MTTKRPALTSAPANNTWTEQQTLAVKTRGVSVSLSAGAGCGKTFVLTERFLDCFALGNDESLPPDELHQLVAITFTERAAREMRDRVRRKCYAALEREAPGESEHWAALLRGLDSARISTIHSFCGTLLRSHAVEAGVDPQFEVLEQSQSEALLSEAVDDELRQRVSERDESTIELAGRFDLPGLRSMVLDLAVQGTDEDFQHWLTAGPDEQVKVWDDYHRVEVVPRVAKRVVESEWARQIVEVLRAHASTNPVMRQRCEVLKELLPKLTTQAGDPTTCLASLRAIRENAKVQGGGTAKNWDDADAYRAFQTAATKLRELIDKVEPVAAFDPADAREAAEVGGRLLQIAAGVRRRYEDRKHDLAALDFDDLLVRARRLLVHPDQAALRQRVGKQIRLLLVDEFQDTDRVQVELVEALCGEALGGGKLFFVGDYKQSIYRFRGADPHVFGQLRDATPPAGRLSLTQNFRSQPAILEFVNALFWYDLGDKYEALRPHRMQATARPAVEFIWAAPDDPAAKENADAMRRREAEWIARRIRAMLDGAEPLVGDGHTARAVQPGDVAILFRALSDVDLYEEQLRRHGIDYYLVGGHAFYAQQEIFDLLNLLRAVASPGDEVSLVGALRSGFFALSDDTIYWLATRAGGLPAALRGETPSEIVDRDQRQRVARARATLAQLAVQRDRLRICELIELALSLTGYDATLLAEYLGERKLANLRKVIEQARTFERNAAFGLTEFLAELAEFVARQPKEPLAATFSEDTHVVRLMTIHQAKGLEFPVVFVPDLGRPTELRTDRVHLDRQLGPLVQLPERADGLRPAGGYALWRVLEEQESLAEMYRLLYVATTRAADYLVLSSGLKSLGEIKGAWMHLLAKRFDLVSGRFIGQLPPGEERPTVRVTMEKPPHAGKTVGRARSVDIAKLIAEVRAADHAPWPGAAAIEPIAPDLSARRQFSFSRLSGKLRERPVGAVEESSPAPATVDPRGLGTLVHAVLATIDFNSPGDWRSTLDLFAERHLPPDSAEVTEAVQLIAGFLASPRARQMAEAPRMFAEAEFWLSLSDHDPHGKPLLLSGYLDRLYQDAAGRWHVVDFKTNRVSSKTMPQVAVDYEMQMLVYGLATERILGEAPASLTLHFLRGGLERSFAWDDVARERAIEQIRVGIARALTTGVS